MVAIPPPADNDPRWSLALGGGAMMDLGFYSLHAQRMIERFAGGPPELVSARGGTRQGLVDLDEWLDAEFIFPSGATGSARCHMAHSEVQMTFRVVGTKGEAVAHNFVQPHLGDRLTVSTDAESRVETLGKRSSYTYQLEAFASAVRIGTRHCWRTSVSVRRLRAKSRRSECRGHGRGRPHRRFRRVLGRVGRPRRPVGGPRRRAW
jgi:predicted dehydrogenase